jgi:hypothetical protein
MWLFENAVFDCWLFFICLVILTQVVVPLWKNKGLFPIFRYVFRIFRKKQKKQQQKPKIVIINNE